MGLLDEISSNDLEEVCRKLDESNGDPAFLEQVVKADMGNPTVGLVYCTAVLHYNCSFKSSLPYIATLL